MTLEISHIVTNGCSFTYCQGLENPSVQGWPALLAKKLNVPVVNLGIKGSGNDGIYRRTLEYLHIGKKYNSKPLYIIAFSQALRREEFLLSYRHHIVKNFHNMATYGDEPIERAIYEHLDDTGVYFMELRKLINWLSVVNLFKANNVPYITSNYMSDHPESIKMLQKNHKNLCDIIYKDFYRVRNFHDITNGCPKLSCGHDGIEAQSVLADYCYNIINEKFGELIPVESDYLTLDQYAYSQPGDFFHYVAWGNNDAWLKDKTNV